MKEAVDFSSGPLPDVDNMEGAPFWEGTLKGELRFPQCSRCRRFHWYPAVRCPYCHSSDIEWRAVNSPPRVYTWTCVRRPLGPLFAIRGPHIVALVEFAEAPGIHLVTNLVGCRAEEVYIGMPLEVVFQRINDRLVMPLFKPAKDVPS